MARTQVLVQLGDALFFVADDGQSGRELWKTDGTGAGTVLFKDINAGPASSNPSSLLLVNGGLYFTADDGVHGTELWKSDGTAAGTFMVKDMIAGADGSSPKYLTEVSGTLFFNAGSSGGRRHLWKSDGTSSGTVLVDPNGDPQQLTNVNGTLFYSGEDFSLFTPTGRELWKSDGTSAGTVLVKDIRTGRYLSSNPDQLTNVNGRLFFTADDGSSGTELWMSAGSSSSTVRVSDIISGLAGSNPDNLINVNSTLYFTANTSTNGRELWKSDGTTLGTAIVRDIAPGTASSLPTGLTNVNGTLYFGANDGARGVELWKSNGTAVGTTLVKDIASGTAASNPSNLVNVDGTLYFVANDGTHGAELWQSNGSEAGTVLTFDFTDDQTSSNPRLITQFNNRLLVTASTTSVGNELFIASLRSAPTAVQISNQAIVESSAPGTLVGTLSTTDPDVANTFTYALVAGTGSGDNSLFTIAGNTLRSATSPDYETKKFFNVRVRSTDQSGLFVEQALSIDVIDVPELDREPVFGDGTNQRSSIKQIVVTFDGEVEVLSNAFNITKRGAGAVDTSVGIAINAGKTIVTLTFSGSMTRGGGQLIDGYYEFQIRGDRIRRGTQMLDTNEDGIGGETFQRGTAETDNYFALYGDLDGDGMVGVGEYGTFRSTFGKQLSDAGFNPLLDYESNGTIGIEDFGQFRSRFGKAKPRF